jgi:hypothetical protein
VALVASPAERAKFRGIIDALESERMLLASYDSGAVINTNRTSLILLGEKNRMALT